MERAERLISAIAEGNLSSTLHERLVKWLLGAPENGIAEKTLAQWAARNIKPREAAPDKREKEGFRKLADTLGVDGHISSRKKTFVRNGSRPSKGRLAPMIRFALRAAAVLIPVSIAVTGARIAYNKVMERAVKETVIYADSGADFEKFTLPDKSTATLTHGSKLAYSDDFASRRRVRLDGEAFFEVARDTLHPFSVHNESMSVVVLGTEFNVKAHDNVPEAEIILVSGKVSVELGNNNISLSPGQKLTLDKSDGTMELTAAGEGEIMRAAHNDLHIEDMHAMEALLVVADYFGKELVVEEGVSTDDYLNITLPADVSLETAINCLNSLSDDAICSVSGDTIVIAKK
jgi:ferric-dicitrate binding protein FerR (iron transport regulator)